MRQILEEILSIAYKQFDTPADQLATDHQQREAFADAVRVGLGQDDLDTDVVIRRLLAMRKTGGLPRLRR